MCIRDSWLFPPRVHELLAEEHGALDVDGVPARSLYQTIVHYNDGSVQSLAGAVNEGSVGSPNIILPTALPSTISPRTTVARPKLTWIADPASFGYALYFEPPPGIGESGAAEVASSVYSGALPFTQFNSDIPGIPSPSPVFTDKWADPDEAWPALSGQLLMLIPVDL